MEFKQVVGNRRTIRFFDPNRPVEPEKIQVMLEAANRSSRAVNADFAKASVTNFAGRDARRFYWLPPNLLLPLEAVRVRSV